MKTTTATYKIEVTTDEGQLSFLKDMPTKPKVHKGIKSQNDKLSRWVEKEYPNFLSYHICPRFPKMLFVSGKSPHLSLTHRVYDFYNNLRD